MSRTDDTTIRSDRKKPVRLQGAALALLALAAWVAEPRAALQAGRPEYAQALGSYLHGLDADILRGHQWHRDLPSVGVPPGA